MSGELGGDLCALIVYRKGSLPHRLGGYGSLAMSGHVELKTFSRIQTVLQHFSDTMSVEPVRCTHRA
jgi:hypothetical protein